MPAATRSTLIYKRVLLHELVETGGLDQPVVRAVRDGAVCMVNPFQCKILHKKASLAVLSDERNAHLFDTAPASRFASTCPGRASSRSGRTEYRGEPIDLVPFDQRTRERFVLKPNDDYGGAGIVLGWTVDDAAWDAAVKRALAQPYIVQERVAIAASRIPSLVDGRVHVIDRMLDTEPFVCHGQIRSGCLTRLSTAALLNVTAGGGSTVPTFVVEKR